MKSVDKEKIYPEDEKRRNQERIDVFYDTGKVRNADGRKLIRDFVLPKPVS